MPHEPVARTLRELMPIGKTPSGTDPVLHDAPETFRPAARQTARGSFPLHSALMIAPRWARSSRAASARDAHDSSAGSGVSPGVSRPVGRRSLPAFFAPRTDALTAERHARWASQHGREVLTTPLRRRGAGRERVWVDEAIEGRRDGTGPLRGTNSVVGI